ncbi:hypothetical protein SAOR_03085, partial [Salinisphaera orenii MK-B5]
MTRIRFRHWLVVLAIALVAHAALLVRFQVETTLTGGSAGNQGVRIALAPEQGAPQPEQRAADNTTREPPSEPEKPAEKATPEPEPQPAPEPIPEPQPEPTP